VSSDETIKQGEKGVCKKKVLSENLLRHAMNFKRAAPGNKRIQYPRWQWTPEGGRSFSEGEAQRLWIKRKRGFSHEKKQRSASAGGGIDDAKKKSHDAWKGRLNQLNESDVRTAIHPERKSNRREQQKKTGKAADRKASSV